MKPVNHTRIPTLISIDNRIQKLAITSDKYLTQNGVSKILEKIIS
jgi:hypothetical protein